MLILSAKISDFPQFHTIINAYFLGVPTNPLCTCWHAVAVRPQVLIIKIPGWFVFFKLLLLGSRSRSGNQSTEMWPSHLVNLAVSLLAAALGYVCVTQSKAKLAPIPGTCAPHASLSTRVRKRVSALHPEGPGLSVSQDIMRLDTCQVQCEWITVDKGCRLSKSEIRSKPFLWISKPDTAYNLFYDSLNRNLST